MKIIARKFGSYQEYHLQNPKTGDFVAILPSLGGIVRQLSLQKNDKPYLVINVADQVDTLKSISKIGYPSALLFPFPSRIRGGKYTFEGKKFQLPVNEPARQNAIHGFMADRPFEVLNTEADESTAQITLRHFYPGDYPGYPFAFELEITYALSAKGQFSMKCQAKNVGTSPMPAAMGWHPYFRLGTQKTDTLKIKIPSDTIVLMDEQMMPTHTDPLETQADRWLDLSGRMIDNVFLLKPSLSGVQTELYAPKDDISLVMWQETGKHKFNYLVVYTPPTRDTVAIEPISGNVNAFNTGDGLVVLKPQEIMTASCQVWLQ